MTATKRGRLRRPLAGLLTAVTALALLVVAAPGAWAATGTDAATLAKANLAKTAGTCAQNPTHNSLGGSAYGTSCTGNGGQPEYWCADFAKWVWQNVGFDVSGLTASAGSFYLYGANHGTLHTSSSYRPQPGDAVVFGYQGGGYAHHVGLVTGVNSDGSVETANGDFGGQSGSQALFAATSSVKPATISAGSVPVGSTPSGIGMVISAYVTPSSSSGSNPPASSGNPYSAAQLCGSGYGVIDSHNLNGAIVYLLYNGSTGDNCVTTLATKDNGAVSMNATLNVDGGGSASDPGSYRWYAGPVREHAPEQCVRWGGSYNGSSWTSDWSHCGAGSGPQPPVSQNAYTPAQVCGSGYGVIDSHNLNGAIVYLLYNGSTGDNCVTTLADGDEGVVSMNATLSVDGGGSASDPGSYRWYAGPVREHAPDRCVQWGGSYNGSSWTSGWSHCGSGSSGTAANPYTAAQVCGSGYGVIDSHDLGGATTYLLYNAASGSNCVATVVHGGAGAVPMSATLSVQGGGSDSDSGYYQWYAGPVSEPAAGRCVQWGGSYDGNGWTSGWSHCG